jgi:putative ABC transport system substrate-binding protein
MKDQVMYRRSFLALLGTASAAWPLAARAKQSVRMPRIGYISAISESDTESAERRIAFVGTLSKLGWVDGRNIHIDYRWGAASEERVRAAAPVMVNDRTVLIRPRVKSTSV